jgi:hypothetical protein
MDPTNPNPEHWY